MYRILFKRWKIFAREPVALRADRNVEARPSRRLSRAPAADISQENQVLFLFMPNPKMMTKFWSFFIRFWDESKKSSRCPENIKYKFPSSCRRNQTILKFIKMHLCHAFVLLPGFVTLAVAGMVICLLGQIAKITLKRREPWRHLPVILQQHFGCF